MREQSQLDPSTALVKASDRSLTAMLFVSGRLHWLAAGLPLFIWGCSLLSPSDDELQEKGPRDAAIDSVAALDSGTEAEAGGCADFRACPGGYCRAGHCEPCSDLTSLESLAGVAFGSAEPLSVLNASAEGQNLRFPRVFGADPKLLYSRDVFGGQMWLTADYGSNIGAALPSPPDGLGTYENGALKVDAAVSGPLSPYNFFFGKIDPGDAGSLRSDLYGASLDRSGSASSVVRLPPPFNPNLPTPRSSYSLAVSQTRAFWMINNGTGIDVHLLTTKLDGDLIPSEISLKLTDDCEVREIDFTPWVTPDTRILLVTATERGQNCQLSNGQPTDILMVKLDAPGLPSGFALPVAGVSRAGSSEQEPSLSPDLCWLYYASSPNSSERLRLYRAHRIQ